MVLWGWGLGTSEGCPTWFYRGWGWGQGEGHRVRFGGLESLSGTKQANLQLLVSLTACESDERED